MSFSDWPWAYFSRDELSSPDTAACVMDPDFMRRLEGLRVAYGAAMPVSSGFRSAAYNLSIGGADSSAHLTGHAVDIAVSGEPAFRLVKLAFAHGFTGVGLKQSGLWETRFVHLDDLAHDLRPRIWTY